MTITVSKSFPTTLSLLKFLIGIVYVTKNHKLNDLDMNVLAYYIQYGINNKSTENLIIDEHLPHIKNIDIARQMIRNSKAKLKKDKIIIYNELKRIYNIISPLDIDCTQIPILYALKLEVL